MKKILTQAEYEKFLEIASYDSLDHEVVESNQKMMYATVEELTDEQVKRFGENGRKVGCCFNFSCYLLAKYKGFLLTCRDLPGIHCVFLYLGEDGELYICDPARAKMENNGNDYFNIPINEYIYKESRFKALDTKQIYRIYHNMFSNDNLNSFLDNFKDDNNTLNYSQMADVKDEDKKLIIAKLNENLTTGVN